MINKLVTILSFSCFVLISCGDDSTSDKVVQPDGENPEISSSSGGKLTEVATIYDLGGCTAERENHVVFVFDKNTDYICRNGKWIDLATMEIKSSSSSEQDTSETQVPSSSGTKDTVIVESSSAVIVESSSSAEKVISSSSAKSSSSIVKSSSSVTSSSSSVKSSSSIQPSLPTNFGTITDSRDNKTYKTVKIGDQV